MNYLRSVYSVLCLIFMDVNIINRGSKDLRLMKFFYSNSEVTVHLVEVSLILEALGFLFYTYVKCCLIFTKYIIDVHILLYGFNSSVKPSNI